MLAYSNGDRKLQWFKAVNAPAYKKDLPIFMANDDIKKPLKFDWVDSEYSWVYSGNVYAHIKDLDSYSALVNSMEVSQGMRVFETNFPIDEVSLKSYVKCVDHLKTL